MPRGEKTKGGDDTYEVERKQRKLGVMQQKKKFNL